MTKSPAKLLKALCAYGGAVTCGIKFESVLLAVLCSICMSVAAILIFSEAKDR